MFLDSIFSLIAVLLIAFCIYKQFGLNPSVTPFVSLMSIVSFISLLSLVNFLMPSIWITYVIAVISFAFVAYKNKQSIKKDISEFFTPGVIMFCIASGLMFIVLSSKQPILTQWDEFSFWGTSQKLTKYHSAIYTYYPSSLIGKTTPPALAVLSVFFQPIGQGFLEWKAFFSYDVLFFASFCAWTASFKKDKWHYAFMVFLFGFMTPFVFEVYTKIVYLVPVYMSIMADIPLGITFAGAIATYLFACDKNYDNNLNGLRYENKGKHILALLPVLISFTLMKDMGFAFSFIIIMIVFIDLVIAQKDFSFFNIKGILGKISICVIMGITTIATFMAWTVHMANVLQANRFELGGAENLGMAEMLIVGIKELLSPEKSQKFIDMQGEMIGALVKRPVSMFGSGIRTFIVIFALFIAALILVKGKENIIKIIGLWVTNIIGFVAYYVFHLFIYVYIFKGNAYGLPSYERYMYPYYIAFMVTGVLALCIAVMNPRFEKLSKLALFGFSMIVFLLFNYLVSHENTFLMYTDNNNSVMENINASYESIEDVVEDDDVIFCFSEAEDSGERWFKYTYAMSPAVIVMDIPWFDGSGMDQQTYNMEWRKRFIEYVENAGITHLMIDYGNDKLQQAFGQELGVNVNDYDLYRVGYYEITNANSKENKIEFSLVKNGEVER